MARWVAHLLGQLHSRLARAYDPAASLITGGLYQQWTLSAERFLDRQPVLEVGCGQGYLLTHLARKGFDVLGVDNSPQMVDLARARLRCAGIERRVIQADARALPLADASVGTIVNVLPASYVKEEATWAEYVRVLRPDGRWVVVEGPVLGCFHPCLLGWYLMLLAEFGLSLGRKRPGAAVPAKLFPTQRREFVQVGPTRVSVVILERA